MKTETWFTEDKYEDTYKYPIRRNKRHKCELKPYKREKYKYKGDDV